MKAWHDAASLILAARYRKISSSIVSPAIHNYKLLCLKRHQKSSFMPGLYVFPGGTVDPTDADLKWREHFAIFGLDSNKLASLIPKTSSRPQILQSAENELLKEVSLRITTIRETFEECGILICRRDRGDSSGWAEHVSVSKDELQTWQNRVHNDATEFLNLCRKLECYPDLFALHEWRNWLTPTVINEKRFNTAFYLTCMSDVPHAEYEAAEMEDLKWDTPEKFVSMDIAFPPPQHNEIAWLTKIKNIDDLLDIAVKRNKEGMQLYMPVPIQMKDGVIMLMPGDTMYPKEVNLLEARVIVKSDISINDLKQMSPVKRTEFYNDKVNIVFTENGENHCMSFPPSQFSKKYIDEVPKNKL